jgi:hypothetical protein
LSPPLPQALNAVTLGMVRALGPIILIIDEGDRGPVPFVNRTGPLRENGDRQAVE